jgi:tRNA(His) 5'-end guanylyltransferase
MIFQKGINWNDCPVSQKRGRCITKQQVSKKAVNLKTNERVIALRSEWVVDVSIPIFSQDRRYIDRFVYPEREKEFALTENDLVL